MKKSISVIGTGYVGLVTGACFAEIGHKVVCQDMDERKISILKEGGIPIYEPHLKELVNKNVGSGRLSFIFDIKEAILSSDVIFICVGTPPLENGEADLSAVENITRQVAEISTSYKLVVEKSTVPVQTGEWIKKTLEIYKNKKDFNFDVASNPEFLREGKAVYDFLHPDRIVVGVENERALKILKDIYAPIINHSFECPIHENCNQKSIPFIVTDVKSAELIKHASNSFLATKISFVNAIADICEKAGADVENVAYGMGLDPRIGRDFLNAGVGFGGFCLPKDIQAFIKIAEKLGIDFRLLKEVERINEDRIKNFIEKIKNHIWIIKGKTLGVLGLSFKPDTDDIRFSPSLKIIKELLNAGATIKTYDPKAMNKVKEIFPDIIYCDNAMESAKDSDALIIVTEWQEFKELDYAKIKSLMKRPLIFDGRNMLDKNKMLSLGFEYIGIGR